MNNKNSDILNVISDAVLAVDLAGLVQYANPAACSLLKMSEGEVAGCRREDIIELPSGVVFPDFRFSKDFSKPGELYWPLPPESRIHPQLNLSLHVTGWVIPVIDSTQRPQGCLIIFHPAPGQSMRGSEEDMQEKWKELFKRIKSLLTNAKPADLKMVMGLLGRACRADRVSACILPGEKFVRGSNSKLIEWIREDVLISESMKKDSLRFGMWLLSNKTAGQIYMFPDTGKISGEEFKKNPWIRSTAIQSLLFFPFRTPEMGMEGMISMEWLAESRSYPPGQLDELAMISECIAQNLIRTRIVEILRSTEDRFHTLFKKSSDVIVAISPDSRILYASPSAEIIMGYDPEELAGNSFLQFVPEIDHRRWAAFIENILGKDSGITSIEHRFIHKKGLEIDIKSTFSDQTRDPVTGGLVIHLQNITDRKKFERELIRARDSAEQMSRLKTALLANISHEMRTPLAGILGFANILQNDLEDENLNEMAAGIYRSGRRLLETIESILDLAKFESDKVEMQLEKVDLIQEVKQAMAGFSGVALEKGLDFVLQTGLDELHLLMDRQVFSRIINNLLSNAFKYTENGGVFLGMEVYREQDKSWVRIDVKDTGIGISEKFINKVFDEFQQESSGLSRKFEGAGLGLTISRKLAKMLGGDILVTSEKEKGSVFSIILPVALSESLPLSGEDGKISDKSRMNLPKVLLAGSDLDSTVITRFYLGKNYEVEMVPSADSAIKSLRNKFFHLIICDMDEDSDAEGIKLLSSVRGNKLLAEVPVLALVYSIYGENRQHFMRQGFTDCMFKPFRKEELLKMVRRHLLQTGILATGSASDFAQE